jgi:hypothetical protein
MIDGSMPARTPAVHLAHDRFGAVHAAGKANPASFAAMSKHKPDATHPQRRSRGEIDRNYFFGDVLIKTGAAVLLVLVLIALYTPFTLRDALV